MIQPSGKLEGLIPQPGESPESFIARGLKVQGEGRLDFRPQEGDSLSEYLLRLRVANGLTPEEVEKRLSAFPENLSLQRGDLAQLESGYLGLVNEQRLRILASLYGVPQEWLLQTAQYRVETEIAPMPPTDNAFATMTMRSLGMDTLDDEARQTLEQIFNEIASAVQSAGPNTPPDK